MKTVLLFCYSGIGEKDNLSHKATTPTAAAADSADTTEVVLRRTQSFEADEK